MNNLLIIFCLAYVIVFLVVTIHNNPNFEFFDSPSPSGSSRSGGVGSGGSGGVGSGVSDGSGGVGNGGSGGVGNGGSDGSGDNGQKIGDYKNAIIHCYDYYSETDLKNLNKFSEINFKNIDQIKKIWRNMIS